MRANEKNFICCIYDLIVYTLYTYDRRNVIHCISHYFFLLSFAWKCPYGFDMQNGTLNNNTKYTKHENANTPTNNANNRDENEQLTVCTHTCTLFEFCLNGSIQVGSRNGSPSIGILFKTIMYNIRNAERALCNLKRMKLFSVRIAQIPFWCVYSFTSGIWYTIRGDKCLPSDTIQPIDISQQYARKMFSHWKEYFTPASCFTSVFLTDCR